MKHALILVVGVLLLSLGTSSMASEMPSFSVPNPSEAGAAMPPDWLLEIVAQNKPVVSMTVTSPSDPLWLLFQASSCVNCSPAECGCCTCISYGPGCCWECC